MLGVATGGPLTTFSRIAAVFVGTASVMAVVPFARPQPPPPKPVLTVVDSSGAAVPGAYTDNGVRVLKDGNVFALDWLDGNPLAIKDMRTVDRFQLGGFKDSSCTQPIIGWAKAVKAVEYNLPSGSMVSIEAPINYETRTRAALYRLSGPVEHVYEGGPCTWVLEPGPYVIVEVWTGLAPSVPGPLRLEWR